MSLCGNTNAEAPAVSPAEASRPDDLAATFVSDQQNFARYAAESKATTVAPQFDKVTYRFVPAPVDLAPIWYRVTLYQRIVAGEMFRVTRGRPLAVNDEWHDDVCRALQAHGNERMTAKKALAALHKLGLIVVADGFASVLWCETDSPRTTSGVTQESLRAPSGHHQAATRTAAKCPESNVGTVSALKDLRREEREEKEIKRESACAPPTGKFPSSTLVAQLYEMFRAEAHKRGLRPAPTLTNNQRMAAAERVLELADGGDLEAAARSYLQAAFDDSASTGKSVVLTLTDCQPGRPAALRAVRGGRVAPAPAAPHSAFDNQPDDAEIVLARWEAEDAAKKARTA